MIDTQKILITYSTDRSGEVLGKFKLFCEEMQEHLPTLLKLFNVDVKYLVSWDVSLVSSWASSEYSELRLWPSSLVELFFTSLSFFEKNKKI